MKSVRKISILIAVCFFLNTASAQDKSVEVGGAAMYPSKNIVENAVTSKDHTTLVAAVKAAGLVETLQSTGPFTVFAPTNAAFDLLPDGTVETLLKPEKTYPTDHSYPGKHAAVQGSHAINRRPGSSHQQW